jgi:hypothetical protein
MPHDRIRDVHRCSNKLHASSRFRMAIHQARALRYRRLRTGAGSRGGLRELRRSQPIRLKQDLRQTTKEAEARRGSRLH